jgi:hypothetical protein
MGRKEGRGVIRDQFNVISSELSAIQIYSLRPSIAAARSHRSGTSPPEAARRLVISRQAKRPRGAVLGHTRDPVSDEPVPRCVGHRCAPSPSPGGAGGLCPLATPRGLCPLATPRGLCRGARPGPPPPAYREAICRAYLARRAPRRGCNARGGREVLGWPRRCELAHAFLWEYSRRRLRLAQFLGQPGVSLTNWRVYMVGPCISVGIQP